MAILFVAGIGAGAWSWHLAQQVARLERAATLTHERIDRLEELLDEFAVQELVYVGSGRTDFGNVGEGSRLLQQAAADITTLVSGGVASTTPPARALADDAMTLVEIDSRARDDLRTGLDLMAAELTFTETQQTRRALRQELRRLASTEAGVVSDARNDALLRASAGILGVAILFAGVVIWWSLVPAPTMPASPPASTLLFDSVARPVSPTPDGPDLQAAAHLCTAIGRLTTAEDLPTLLERAASILDASGVVVWMAAGEELFAAAASGYPPHVVRQLGPIGRSAINATATAWRSETLQVVSGDTGGRSALAAPMLGPERCVGVLAVEVPPGREDHAGTRAVTILLAAQLTAALAGWPAASTAAPASGTTFDRAAEA
jgi:hypothetical protein